MEKRKCLAFLFCLILCYSLFQHTARAQSSSQVSIFSQGSITYSPSNVNLAVIPDDWSYYEKTYNSFEGNVHIDYDVTHNGHVSIRIDPHTSEDTNTYRECDGTWYVVKPGDHIVAKCWIKVDDVTPYTNEYEGGRLGMDFYGSYPDGSLSGVVDGHPHDGAEHIASEVHWGTVGWTQKTWDIIIPDTIYTKDIFGNVIPPTPITQMVLWLDVRPLTLGICWFADAELYINPT